MNLRKTMIATCATLALSATAAGAQTLQWSTGPVGGGWYTISTGMAKWLMEDNPGMQVRIVPGAGTANPTKVDNGQAQLGFGLDLFTADAVKGKGIYDGKPHKNLRFIGQSFGDNYTHFLRVKGAKHDLKSFMTEARGEGLSLAKAGTVTEVLFTYIMQHFNTSYEGLRARGNKINHADYSEITGQYKDRHIDYVFGTLALPASAFIDMVGSRDGEILDFDADTKKALQQKFGFRFAPIPANTYAGQGKPVDTVVVGSDLHVGADVAEDVVYKIVKTICKQEANLKTLHQSLAGYSCSTAWKDGPAPLHPGAARAYKELKVM